MAKTFIQDAINKTLLPYESSKKSFQRVNEQEIENLRNELYNMIIGNEEAYKDQIDERINKIIERLHDNRKSEMIDDIKINLYNDIPSETALNKKYNVGKVVGLTSALAVVLAVTTVACGSKQDTIVELPVEKIESIDNEDVSMEIDENQLAAEQILKQFSTKSTENVTIAINNLLANGIRVVDKDLSEENQKDLISSEWIQYYLVANIDDITTLEYANFMKEQPGAVLDNDDLIYNFRNMNVLMKEQMLVSMPDNKIDFSNLYNNENDAKLLNEGADILSRLNAATKKADRKAISKEFYDYIQNTVLNSTDKLKYSNSAMATFINAEFSSWTEITKNSNFGRGYYPDDELEAKLMTVVSNCGMSSGEMANVDLEDQTKKSLESINVIRVLDSLKERKENITNLISLGQLYYLDEAHYSNLKSEIAKGIDLSNYKELESFTEKREKEIKNIKPQINKNDSQVSNGQGGTIAKDDMIANGINPTDSDAKTKYEEAVKNNYEETTVVKNNSGEVIDANQAASWAKQGAIDANNGVKNNNVPSLYQEAYNNGWNAANDAKRQAEQNTPTTTTTETVTNGDTTQTTLDETYEDFKDNMSNDNNGNNDISNNEDINSSTETKTEFVPVEDGETIIEETEEVTGFAQQANAQRNIEVKTLTKNRVDSYKELKNLLQQAMDSYQEAINIYDEIKENNMSK